MNYKELLAKLQEKRDGLIKKIETLHTKASDEARMFDEAEQEAFDKLMEDVNSVDSQIKRTESLEKLMGSIDVQTKSVTPKDPSTELPAGRSVDIGNARRLTVERAQPKGTVFTRYAMALAASKGNLQQAVEIAKNYWSSSTPEVEMILKAAVAAGNTTDTNWANPLAVYRDAAGEFIELLRPLTILGRMTGIRQVPFNVRFPRQTAGATVGWVGQAGYKPVSKLQFDMVQFPFSKVAGIVVITQELARFSQPAAEALVRQDMIDTIAAFMDQQFIDPSVTASANVSPASITNGITPTMSTGTTVAAILADTDAMFVRVTSANIPLRNIYWVMHPRSRIYLASLRTAQDVYAFPEVNAGMFRGFPIIDSTGVALAASPTDTYIALIVASEVLLADDNQVMIDVSTEAAVAMDSAPSGGTALTSLWQQNLIGIRAERYAHWMRRRDQGVAVLQGVDY